MTKLSKALQKYYTRENNRIVFANGLSLNKMAWVMWEKLNFRGIDPSVLSRVLTGERTFSPEQLSAFCDVLKISKSGRMDLQEALRSKMADKFGETEDNIVFIVEDRLSQMETSRMRGLSSWVIDLATETELMLDNKIHNGSKKLLELYSQVLLLKVFCMLEVVNAEDLFPTVSHAAGKIKDIARRIKNKEMVVIAASRVADALYIVGEHRKSEIHLRKALPILRSTTENSKTGNEKSYSLRVAALTAALINRQAEFQNIKKSLVGIFSECSAEVICQSWIKISRGEMKLGVHRDARASLIKAWEAYSKIPNRHKGAGIYRKIQLIRSEIELYMEYQEEKVKGNVEKLAREGIILAENLGYERYAKNIQSMLTNLSMTS